MDKMIAWMTDSFAPKVNKIARNPWVLSLQEAILTAMPFILIGSFITITGIIREYATWMPDLQPIGDFSFGLFSIYLAYLIPMIIMEKKRHKKTAKQAGLAGVAFFLLIANPGFDEAYNILYYFPNFGTGGMIAALIAGLFVGAVMNLFSKKSFFGEDSAMPDFIKVWFDTLIPIFIVLITGWLCTYQFEINVFEVIYEIFSPFLQIGESFVGFVFLNFLAYSFLYTFGISTWVIYPIISAITLQGIDANIQAVAAGNAPVMIHTAEAVGLLLIGGGGTTLALNIMMLRAKSNRLKVIARASIVPSICNINEPLVFGAPIAFNPMLMIPMWIIGLIGPILLYLCMSTGLVTIPKAIFGLWYAPAPILGFVNAGVSGLLFVLVLFVISWLVYYPFFRAYDKQVVEEETKKA